MFNTRNENASLNKNQQQPYLYTFNAFGRTPRKGILGQEMGQKVQKEEITEDPKKEEVTLELLYALIVEDK
jgi:hypothetical protein